MSSSLPSSSDILLWTTLAVLPSVKHAEISLVPPPVMILGIHYSEMEEKGRKARKEKKGRGERKNEQEEEERELQYILRY